MARNRGGTESIKRKMNALEAIKSVLPDEVANIAKNFFFDSFKKQGWEDEGVQRWKPRKGEISGGIASITKKSKGGRGILIQSGDLRKSIIVEFAAWGKIRISSDLPYSAIHNEGLKGVAFGKHPFQMPKRKFMGRSRKMNNFITKKIETRMNIVYKS